jgi:RNA polymerase sigma-70 factor, ECF subfamily
VNCDDLQLVQECLDGDEAATRAFLERYQRFVYSVCFRMMGNHHDAEEAAQESLVRIYRNLSKWDTARPLKPWILTITRNRCLTALEKRNKQPLQNELALELEVERREHSKHSNEELEWGEELDLALEELRPEYRDCFVLFYRHELSYQEIAEAMDKPAGTIKTWLFRARSQIVELLRARGVITEVEL